MTSIDSQSGCDDSGKEAGAGFEHRLIDVGDGVRLHAVIGGHGKPLVLLHGFPQTWYEWRHVMPELAKTHQVIAVDLRGAGRSDKPFDGYDKFTMARDLDRLVKQLNLESVQVVGHDIGGMVAFAWAAQYPETVDKVVILDVPIPGTNVWNRVTSDQRVWHFSFFMKPDLPEMLIAGREREFIDHFIHDRIYNVDAFTSEDIDIFGRSFAIPGAARGMFGWYRALPKDIRDNQAFLTNRIATPILTLGGDQRWGSVMVEMLSELAVNVRGGAVQNCNHWVVEEQPQALLSELRAFLD